MATHDINLAARSGSLVESHKGYDPRLVLFYPLLALLLLVLAGGLAYQQLLRSGQHSHAERTQNQRRILVPGPRGNIYDRHGQKLVENRARFSVVLYLDELKQELRREHVRIHKNYLAAGATRKDVSYRQLEQLARVAVVQRYLDRVNRILHRDEQVEGERLNRHFNSELLLPYTLIDNLAPEEYARLIERLPVVSPLQVFVANSRFYPFGSAAAHTLGYVRPYEEVAAEDFPGDDLRTFKLKGTIGKDGLEQQYDGLLQGEAGGTIFRVDPAGFKINPPLEKRLPVQGKNLVTSLDIDLQLAAEQALGDQEGAVVTLDVRTGEVLVMASKPDYDLNKFSPRASRETVQDMTERSAWTNRAIDGFFPPGSTFKILTSIAGLRHNAIRPDEAIINCSGHIMIGPKRFVCFNGIGHHGDVLLPWAIADSCDVYFYEVGRLLTPDLLAAEARRFHLDRRTGIDLPNEGGRMIIPDREWKRREKHEAWFAGDTANMAIGQGFVDLSPLQMACFVASVARDELTTTPTLVHDPARPPIRGEKIGLTPTQRAALVSGMEDCTVHGTGKLFANPTLGLPGFRVAGKTGTAQKGVKPKQINIAWFLCYAPVENPEIAMAVALVGDTVGESFEGGRNAVPVALAVMKKYLEIKQRPAGAVFQPFRLE
ncbi:MAG: peptidoglycan glycosyltransferase [Verrucomicrobia bacterium]|nr:peptidoglycan glycosyltransferase [Verrucomicrobiota bacterium]